MRCAVSALIAVIAIACSIDSSGPVLATPSASSSGAPATPDAAASPWEELSSLPGTAVAITDDAIYVSKAPRVTRYLCTAPGPNCPPDENAGDGALLRYPRDLSGAPTTIASGLSVTATELHIIGDHALLGVKTLVKLVDGSASPVSANFADTWWGVAADAQAAYTRGYHPTEHVFLRVAATGATEVPLIEPDLFSSHFALDGDYLYLATHCYAHTSNEVCPGGVFRVPKTGGTSEVVVPARKYVGALAVRGSDIYFFAIDPDPRALFHTTIGASQPPAPIYHPASEIPVMGLVATDDGVIVFDNYMLQYVARDGSKVEQIAVGCSMPRVSGDLVACAQYANTPQPNRSSLIHGDSKVFVFRRRR